MCSIVGSYDRNKVKELIELNRYRGEFSHSVSVFCDMQLAYCKQMSGPLDLSKHHLPSGYIICHQQAPTDVHVGSGTHPAMHEGHMLWHNGIIKEDCVKALREELNDIATWDTHLLLRKLIKDGAAGLNEIDGTFSCVWYHDGMLYYFRNEISPMFIDMEDMTISSTKFDGEDVISLPPNQIMAFGQINTVADQTFNTVNNPYYFGAT